MDLIFYSIIFIISLVLALVDVIVGSSSLVIVPALVILGIPIQTVIATNRLYVTAFVLTGLLNYIRKQVPINLKLIAGFIILRVLGSLIGSSAVLNISTETVKAIVSIFMFIAMAAILLLEHIKSSNPLKSLSSTQKSALIGFLMLLLGIYQGFVGGGAGTISRVLLVLFMGYTMLEAALAELTIDFAASLASSIVFILNNRVDYVLLIPMVLGGIIGAFAGSSIAVKKGDKWMRNLLFAVVLLLILKMLFL